VIGQGGDLDDPGKTWAETYGIEEDGSVLVRPDGYVAWRSAKSNSESTTKIEIGWNTALGRRILR
jgi:hypothetical protein